VPSPASSSLILRFDDDLQAEARTVLARSPEPQNSFEVALILETIGQTDATARARGYSSLFDLADQVYDNLEDFHLPDEEPDPAASPALPSFSRLDATATFLGSALPWLAAIVIQMVMGTGFWSSSSLPPQLASGMVLALLVGLVTSAVFIVPYSRRATFYRVQGNQALAAWAAKRMLGWGALCCAAVPAGLYLVLQHGLGAYSAATNRSFIEMAIAIAFLQLALAPLCAMHAFRWLGASVGAGAVTLVLGLVLAHHRITAHPLTLIGLQLLALTVMIAIAVAGGVWTLRPWRHDAVQPPSGWAVVRSGAPYALFGAAYFLLVLVSQLVAGGLLHGGYRYQSPFAASSGSALLVLLPLFSYVTIAGERLSERARNLVALRAVTECDSVGRDLEVLNRRHRRGLLLVGVVSCGAMVVLAEALRSDWGLAALVTSHLGLFVSCLVSFVALAFGLLSSHLLFLLARPDRSARSAAIGVVIGLVASWLSGLVFSDGTAAAIGLVVGTAAFAVFGARAAQRALTNFGPAYFGAV
jgi:hypothetical protein